MGWVTGVVVLFLSLCLIMGTWGMIGTHYQKLDLCEDNNMKLSTNENYCIQGDKAYLLMKLDGEWKMMKEVVSLDGN